MFRRHRFSEGTLISTIDAQAAYKWYMVCEGQRYQLKYNQVNLRLSVRFDVSEN